MLLHRSGSTIVDYSVSALSFNDEDVRAVKSGIFTQLEEFYPMIYDSSTFLNFAPNEVFLGDKVTVTCGPPPGDLSFAVVSAEWRRDSKSILPDSDHDITAELNKSVLTVSRFFTTDNGRYDCKLISETKSVFRQTSDGIFSLKEAPRIEVEPLHRSVECEVGKTVALKCSVQSPYKVEFTDSDAKGNNVTYNFQINNCAATTTTVTVTCQVINQRRFNKIITLSLSTDSFRCVDDEVFGSGFVGDKGRAPCGSDEVGEKTADCAESGEWVNQTDTCILQVVQDLLSQSQSLSNNTLPDFLKELNDTTVNLADQVVNSSNNINAIVEILSNVANASSSLSIIINPASMENILFTAGVLTTDDAKESWDILNFKNSMAMSDAKSVQPKAASSSLLFSLEALTRSLTNGSFNIGTPFILLNKTTFEDTFNADLNSSVEIDILEAAGGIKSISLMTFASMDNVLPPRDENNSTLRVIGGRVVLVQSSDRVNNVSFTFDILNNNTGNSHCVFWNFSLFNGLGGWDDEGCQLVSLVNDTASCQCNHLTSFSILMSPNSRRDPVLDFITYIGVGISMGSLVICLIIEAVIWRKIRKNKTSYLRHVSIVNIAVSLLIADIWFIIGAAISDAKEENPPACTAATFFIHFFYLALFFWMFASALLLLYHTVSVFDGGLSKASMMAIGFSLGYGVPLIIAVITIAVTAPTDSYTRESGVCWLNLDKSKALLAFVIPALLIVVINFLILLVVLYKMLRSRVVSDAAQSEQKHALVVIARSLAVLTPFFGLTWGLGVGTMTNPNDRGIHIAFAFFNSLQGFFILVFGTLLDRKVRSEIAMMSQSSGAGTRTTSGNASSSGLGFLQNLKRRRDGYNVSSNMSREAQSFSNT
ncbi:adhesion G protein-coupled receptor F4-like isoform 2-T4 [Aulostomus maculatus]